jgi:glycosyltransferase involved in cell wall biosynthesis
LKLALSTLCENPRRRTGLSTLFPHFVAAARREFPGVQWLVFAGAEAAWPADPGVEVCRDFPSNERRTARLLADQLRVAAAARDRGASALMTVGFVPLRTAGLAVAMQIVTVDRPEAAQGLRAAYRRWALARGLRRAALVIVNSAWAATQLAPARAQVVISPEGLLHAQFSPEGPAGGPGLPPKYFLWASNLYPYKRIELALAAYGALPPELRAEYPLLIAGGGWGPGRERAEREARRLGLGSQVRFLGWVDDQALPGLYRGARLHLLSSAYETFGRSALEAMACGCPSVLQDLPVLREVAGEAAVFVDYRDAAGAAAAIVRLNEDGALRGGVRTAGLARAQRFSFERLARERVGPLLQLLGAPS